MFVCNVSLNRKKFLKFIIVIFAIMSDQVRTEDPLKILKEIEKDAADVFINDEISSEGVANISPENYTNVLKEVHEDIDTYIGQKICFSGYVYRVADLKENEFILARDMELNSKETVVVGFLSFSEKAKEYENYTWVNITGTLEKTTYRNEDIPRLKIEKIEKCEIPENPKVKMPDDFFVPTAVIY